MHLFVSKFNEFHLTEQSKRLVSSTSQKWYVFTFFFVISHMKLSLLINNDAIFMMFYVIDRFLGK